MEFKIVQSEEAVMGGVRFKVTVSPLVELPFFAVRVYREECTVFYGVHEDSIEARKISDLLVQKIAFYLKTKKQAKKNYKKFLTWSKDQILSPKSSIIKI